MYKFHIQVLHVSNMSDRFRHCSDDALNYFSENIGLGGPILRVNALVVINGILMGFMVGIGAYGHRYRHIPLIRFLLLAATTLFLPIVSYIVSSGGLGIMQSTNITYHESDLIIGKCKAKLHVVLVLAWTALGLNIGINSTALVAADAREGRSIPPDVKLLIQVAWTSYLGIYTSWAIQPASNKSILLLLGPFGVIFAKLVLKCYAWYIAKESLSFGRNPRLIVGYMDELQDGSHHAELASEIMPPPLIVTGEHTMKVREKPCGYELKWMSNRVRGDMYSRVRGDMHNKGLVTFEKVWQLNDTILRSKSLQLKELCFSFALFKLLRCRIARYTIIEVGFIKGSKFLRQILLEDNDGERVVAVIAHELSFLHDYYYSSLPISYSKSWLPILSGFISLLSICYCLFVIIVLSNFAIFDVPLIDKTRKGQINCAMYCLKISPNKSISVKSFGTVYFDIIPMYILAALVMLAEVRDIASYICSNWIKVALICQYVKHGSWQQSALVQRCVSCVLQRKGKLIRNWEEKMGQSSVLALHPRKTPMALLRRLVRQSGQSMKIPSTVKSAIVIALRKSYERGEINGDVPSFQRILHLQDNNKIIWTFRERGAAEIMLVCHIATTIVGARSPSSTDHMSAANHLSQTQYCAYLLAYCPELLPEDEEWCKSLYKAVEKDGERVLVGNDFCESGASELEYRTRLIELLSAEGNHEILKDGARFAERLIGLTEGEETAWKILAAFWSKMILYVAPSDNIDGHMEAIARGGELVTLLWALVTHLGIVGRSDDTTTDV
ncbi:hypothetical protein VPH35_113687 [Triticum aestivum]